MKVYKVLLEEGACPLIEDSISGVLGNLETEIRELAIGETSEFTVEPIEMSEDEFRSLPEWTGP